MIFKLAIHKDYWSGTMEQEKYYTPKIEQFHIGFQFEIKGKDEFMNDIWIPRILTLKDKLEWIDRGIKAFRVRVKRDSRPI